MATQSKPHRIIGIDPGSNTTGWAVIEAHKSRVRLIESGILIAKSSLKRTARIFWIAEQINERIERLKPDALSIEEAFYCRSVRTVLVLGETRGVLMYVGMQHGLSIHEYSPSKIKQVVAGNGNAEKEAVAARVSSFLKLKERPESLDETDAIAIALCHWVKAVRVR